MGWHRPLVIPEWWRPDRSAGALLALLLYLFARIPGSIAGFISSAMT